MARMKLSRRAVLRGGGAAGLVALPLPRLGAMLDGNGTAYASGAPLRRTFGTWFFGNGVIPDRWIPKGEGRDFPLSDQLAPFAAVKSKLTVVSGMQLKTGRQSAHSYGTTGALTGAREGKDSSGKNTGSVQLPTIDQVIADVIAKDAPRRSFSLGVTQATPRTHGDMYFCSSFTSPTQANFPEFNPAAAFKALFGNGVGGPKGGMMPDDRVGMVRRSVLDLVQRDAGRLERRLGGDDRKRLEEHLDGIRDLEKRLFPPPLSAACASGPAATAQAPTVAPDTLAEAPPAVNKAMADLLVLALSCDLTRVFAFMFSYPAAHVHFRHLGAGAIGDDFHNTLCHGGDDADVHRGVLYEMQCLAYLLEQMDKVVEGNQTLLDNSCILTSTCVAYGKTHQREDWPILIAGRAGGALQGNMHVRAPMDNPTKVLLTLANAYGANLKQLGKEDLLATAELPGIRT
jgi:hypothetical protein